MSPPLAYFLTWTCYGQRLHGDSRGSVDIFHNATGNPVLLPNPARERHSRERMTGGRVSLSGAMCTIAGAAIQRLCVEQGWYLLAQNVRPTHTHVVVNCRARLSPERAMSQFKARVTRELRIAKLASEDQRLWTRHGSTRWINQEAGLYAAIAYVNEWQSGPKREVLEARKRALRYQVRELREWLEACAPSSVARSDTGQE